MNSRRMVGFISTAVDIAVLLFAVVSLGKTAAHLTIKISRSMQVFVAVAAGHGARAYIPAQGKGKEPPASE